MFIAKRPLCSCNTCHVAVKRAASRPNYRWALRLSALYSRRSNHHRHVQLLKALSQSNSTDYFHQCVLQLVRLHRDDDLSQWPWCRRWLGIMPVPSVLSPNVRPNFSITISSRTTPPNAILTRGSQVSTGRCILDIRHSVERLPNCLLPIWCWRFATAGEEVYWCHYCHCIHSCCDLPFHQHIGEGTHV